MNTPAPKAWFLGPKAENQEFIERMLLEAFRDYCYWRRNFHPEDLAYVRASDRLKPEFLEYQETLHDQLFEMLSQLKRSMPFFSPRYLGHMAKDLLTPGLLGYVAAMFYNQNNVTREAATITTRFEAQALRGLAAMLGYDPARAWGHLCSGGTLANIEALWVARNLRLFPYQVALARHEAPAPWRTLLDDCLPTGFEPGTMTVAATLDLHQRLDQLCAREAQIAERMAAVSLNRLGLAGFYLACVQAGVGLPQKMRIVYSQNAHYSLRKSLALLGLGEDAALRMPLDQHLRLDITALKDALAGLPANQQVLAVVGVYGSTEEGAVDDFDQLAALQEATPGGFWLHGDACYGGYALSLRSRETEADPTASLQQFLQQAAGTQADLAWDQARCRRWLRVSQALSRCNSIALDPHKLGYLPYPAGTVLFQDHRSREFIRCDAPYLNSEADQDADHWGTPYPGHYTLEGSRPGATSAAVWLAHRTVSLDRQGHGLLVGGTLAGASYLQQVLETRIPQLLPGLHCRFLCQEPDLNLLCYTFSGHWQGRPLSLWQTNQAIEALYQALLAREEQPRQTQDFIVSMTRLEAASYGSESLNAYWQRLAPESDSQVCVTGRESHDDGYIALLRTVVMDPFLPEALTRSDLPAQAEPLAECFARTLVLQLNRILTGMDKLEQSEPQPGWQELPCTRPGTIESLGSER